MIKIQDGFPARAESFGANIGKKVSINRYLRPDSKVDGFRFGTIESLSKSKNGWYILVSYQEGNHHEEKKVSAYSLKYIAEGVIHD
jgi:hypothetical protein